MSSPSETLVNHLTDSLSGNSEAQLTTQQLLSESLSTAPPEVIQQELERSKESPPSGRRGFLRKRRAAVFLLFNLFLILGLITPTILNRPAFLSLPQFYGFGPPSANKEQENFFQSTLSQSEQDFVNGDSSLPFEQKYLTHFQNNPEEPSALALHLLQSKENDKELFEKGKSIDPKNAFFPLLQSARKLEKAMKRNPAYRGRRSRRATTGIPRKIIADQALFDEGFDQLRTAVALPTFQDYSLINQQDKLATLPPETGMKSRIARLVTKADSSFDSSLLTFASTIDAAAYEQQKTENSQGIRELFDLSLTLFQYYNAEPSLFIPALVTSSYLTSINTIFSNPDVEKHLTPLQKQQIDIIAQEVDFLSKGSKTVKKERELSLGSGMLTRLSTAIPDKYFHLTSPPSAEEIKPERYYWQTVLERIAGFFIGMLLFLLSCILVGPFKKKKPLNQITSRFLLTTSTRQLLFTSLLISILAIGVHLLWTRLTPLGMLNRSWMSGSLAHLSHLVAFFLLILVSSILTARHLAAKRLSPLQLAKPFRLRSAWPLVLLVLAYPLCGLADTRKLGVLNDKVHLIILAILGAWFLWLFFNSLRTHQSLRLGQKLALRYTGILLVVPTFLAICSIPIAEIRGAYWIKRDHFNSTNHHPHGMGRFESDLTLAFFERQQKLQQKLTELQASDPNQ